MAEVVLGPHQQASDVFSNDLAKNRYFFLAPYIKYRQHCFGERIKTFEDLAQVFEPDVSFSFDIILLLTVSVDWSKGSSGPGLLGKRFHVFKETFNLL